MAEFTPINTQEEFDSAIKDRLARQESKIRGEYADLEKNLKSLQTEKESYEKTIADNKTAFDDLTQKYTEATGKIAKYEADELKTKIAIETGLPMELRDYISGSSEDEIRKSAEQLGKFTKVSQTPPLANPEGEISRDNFSISGKVNEDRAMKKFVDSLKAINE